MTRYEYTPGPWQSDAQFIVAPDPNGIHPDIYIAEIAETDDEDRVASPRQQKANKRLIATAPELLETLTECIQLWDGLYSNMADPEETVIWNRARAAVAEAKPRKRSRP